MSATASTSETERRFELFGSSVRILVGSPAARRCPPSPLAAVMVERRLRQIHRTLSRFDPDSELSRLNRDSSPTVGASADMLAFVEAARELAGLTGGLVDATLLDEVEASGYVETFERLEAVPLELALRRAPARGPARPRSQDPWPSIAIDRSTSTITRPPGIRFDSGGVAKGLAVDIGAHALRDYTSFGVDCGGDLRVGGIAQLTRTVELCNPFTDRPELRASLREGAVATTGINRRVWMRGGQPEHHVIDPSSGRPAWSGIVQATAVAPTAIDAEGLAKAAMLSGGNGAQHWLERWGGVIYTDAGEIKVFGPLAGELERIEDAA